MQCEKCAHFSHPKIRFFMRSYSLLGLEAPIPRLSYEMRRLIRRLEQGLLEPLKGRRRQAHPNTPWQCRLCGMLCSARSVGRVLRQSKRRSRAHSNSLLDLIFCRNRDSPPLAACHIIPLDRLAPPRIAGKREQSQSSPFFRLRQRKKARAFCLIVRGLVSLSIEQTLTRCAT